MLLTFFNISREIPIGPYCECEPDRVFFETLQFEDCIDFISELTDLNSRYVTPQFPREEPSCGEEYAIMDEDISVLYETQCCAEEYLYFLNKGMTPIDIMHMMSRYNTLCSRKT